MFFSVIALMLGILCGIMLLVVIFSLLAMARRANDQAKKLFEMGWEEGQWADSQSMVEKVQTTQEPFEKEIRIPRMSIPGLPH